MLLVVGGAFSGKRRIVKERQNQCNWISAYDNHSWEIWPEKWEDGKSLVLEGWEKWIEKELESGKNLDDVTGLFKTLIRTLADQKESMNSMIILIMLEMGRGIVPLEKKDRELRDAAGWILQEAAKHADEVLYVWHGLAKSIKDC
jgi:adenosylcobinamide kinase / adenosylcobinamide-phosphate guanylyltransferase